MPNLKHKKPQTNFIRPEFDHPPVPFFLVDATLRRSSTPLVTTVITMMAFLTPVNHIAKTPILSLEAIVSTGGCALSRLSNGIGG